MKTLVSLGLYLYLKYLPPHEATEVGTVFKCFSSGKNSPEHLLFSRTVLHKADLGDLEKPIPSGKSKESFLLQKQCPFVMASFLVYYYYC